MYHATGLGEIRFDQDLRARDKTYKLPVQYYNTEHPFDLSAARSKVLILHYVIQYDMAWV